ncbi:MAG: hypothetical protein LBK47_01085 [Prevotellaceae bacterium]|jgi:hypothetical protein|nr:hypothetical protein [Prevotellaceae bacterium]
MKIQLLLFCMLFYTTMLQAQQQLYFFRAIADEYAVFYDLPPVQIIAYTPKQDTTLWVYKDHTRALPDQTSIRTVAFYPEYNVFVFTLFGSKSYTLYAKHLDTIVEMPTQCTKGYSEDPFLSMRIVNNHWAYSCSSDNDNVADKDYAQFRGIDFSLSSHFEMSAPDFKDLHLTGVVAQRVILMPNDGRMYLPIVADIENRPPFSVELPKKYWVSKETDAVILVNDNQKMLLTAKSVNPVPHAAYGYFYATLYNKRKNTWSDIELKGNAPTIMTYGRWLAGTVQDSKDWDYKFTPQEENSPGKAARDSVAMEYSFDDRASNHGIYSPGILYLFNTETEKYIEWDTKQGDSEMLLVQDEVAYYRVFDAIYKAAIIKGEKLGAPELLVKDKHIVPSIHWAFFGKPGKLAAITTEKSIIYSEPDKPTKMYLIKGDIVTVLEEKEGWIKMEYEGKKMITGWIKKEDTKN